MRSWHRSWRTQPKAASDWAGKSLSSKTFGAVAQLGEHLLCKQGVAGSIPVRSTFCVVVLLPSNLVRPDPYRFAAGP
jgi:hypothetical protein